MSVEQYPCIWDINHADYRNRDIKDLAWEQICKEVYDDWETCADKSNKCAELKKRWTNIRDYYRKEVQNAKKVPTGSAAKKVSEGNYPQEKEEDSESNQTPNVEHNIEPEAINHLESPKPTLPVVKQKRKKDVPSEILNTLQQKQKQTPANTDEDDDTKYLLSFRSYMKTMNARQKIDFKVGMLNLVKTVTMENDPSPPQSRYTNYYHYRDNSSGPKNSPIYLQSPSPSPPTYHSFSQQQNDLRTNTP
ncbi:uncharacterized protein LOC113233371 [Hyposmocoma kahamanoa]|uniref:uncharacterized protein LOC113233371 n=1 Tax=Hyposmocoma kahamanoa TaxID=1477025 RepID=UPI000E6D6480|nr:uncharacterized protein LOC113233371 [Hyposmocoma kahamanoa]